MTAGDLIRASLRLIGVVASGETPSPDEMSDTLSALNIMLGGWSVKRLAVYCTTSESFNLVAGTASYTIGSGGTFNTVRPQKIIGAFIRDSSGVDYPVDVHSDRSRYNAWEIKTNQGRPEELYYDSAYTLGRAHLYPVPDEAYTLYIESWKPLTQIAGLTTDITLPGEYLRALKYNLAVEVAPEFGVAVPVEVASIAAESMTDVKRMNVPDITSKLDPELVSHGAMDINRGY